MSRRLRHLPSWLLRRGLQFGVFVFVVYSAFGGVWRNYKVAHNNPRLVGLIEGDAWATAYASNESFLGLFGEPYRASFDVLGMPWAATVGGLRTVDPILALSHFLSGGAPATGVLTGVLAALVIAVVLGKVFCSHLCPMRLVFEVGQVLRAGLLRLRIPLPHFHSSWRLGGWVLLGGLAASVFAGMAVWMLILPYVNLVAGIFMMISAGTAAGLLTVVVWWAMIDLLVAPGFFCHNLCPQGFLLEKLGRFSVLRLVTTRQRACPTKCRVCSMVCPYGLSPRKQAPPVACDNCGQCVRACPEQKLGRRLRLPVLAAVLLGCLWPSPAQAHHNKGLPHYGYYENYPQVPTQELVVVQGRWEMGASIFNFQGYERKDASAPRDVKFFIYVYDLDKDANYTGPVDFEILHDGETVAAFSREEVDEELIYSTRETMPASGDYQLVAHLRAAPDTGSPSLEFFIDLEEDSVSWPLLLALLGPLVPLFALALLGRTRKGRAYWMRSQALEEDEDDQLPA